MARMKLAVAFELGRKDFPLCTGIDCCRPFVRPSVSLSLSLVRFLLCLSLFVLSLSVSVSLSLSNTHTQCVHHSQRCKLRRGHTNTHCSKTGSGHMHRERERVSERERETSKDVSFSTKQHTRSVQPWMSECENLLLTDSVWHFNAQHVRTDLLKAFVSLFNSLSPTLRQTSGLRVSATVCIKNVWAPHIVLLAWWKTMILPLSSNSF